MTWISIPGPNHTFLWVAVQLMCSHFEKKKIRHSVCKWFLSWHMSVAELALITPKSLKACKVLEGHALRIIDEWKKRRALGVVPQKQPSNRRSDASSFRELRNKGHRKENPNQPKAGA